MKQASLFTFRSDETGGTVAVVEPGYKVAGPSKQAAKEMQSKAGTLRNQALEELAKGAGTADEIAERVGVSILAMRPRLSELLSMNLIEDSGARRKTSSGKTGTVWALRKNQNLGGNE